MYLEKIVFPLVIIGLLLADFLLVGKKSHKITTKEATLWSLLFVGVSLLFAGFIYVNDGAQKATEFLTAYTIEKVLSVDNLFVFVMVFGFFKVPDEYQHKVLFYGVFGAIVMRAIFIFLGIGIMNLLEFEIGGHQVNILLIAFGLFLIVAGVKSGKEAFDDDEENDQADFSKSPGAKFISYLFGGRVSTDYNGDKFFVRMVNHAGKLTKYATPLLVVVAVVEFTDLLFAVDSIPAIFAVSKDPFILYSSNVFAILGLRSMYFLLANLLPMFTYLKHGLAIILSFIGIKMIIAPWYHIDSTVSLLVVLFVLIASTVVSLALKLKSV